MVRAANIGGVALVQRPRRRRGERAQWLGGCSGVCRAAQSQWLPLGGPEVRGGAATKAADFNRLAGGERPRRQPGE